MAAWIPHGIPRGRSVSIDAGSLGGSCAVGSSGQPKNP